MHFHVKDLKSLARHVLDRIWELAHQLRGSFGSLLGCGERTGPPLWLVLPSSDALDASLPRTSTIDVPRGIAARRLSRIPHPILTDFAIQRDSFFSVFFSVKETARVSCWNSI